MDIHAKLKSMHYCSPLTPEYHIYHKHKHYLGTHPTGTHMMKLTTPLLM